MAFIDLFKGLSRRHKDARYIRMLNGSLPIFSQFGQNIYASDLVQNCIDIIATEISKLQPRHIRTDSQGMQHEPKGNINRLFRFAPNPLMTTSEFLEKIIWLLMMKYNVFILPMYDRVISHGIESKSYTAFYPLNPSRVEFLQDPSGTLLIKFYFESGADFTLPYTDVIHLRHKYSMNDLMGGGRDGQPDNAALLKMLEIDHTSMQGLEKAVRIGLSIRGILKINTMMDDAGARKERDRILKLIEDGKSGILPLDLKGEYTPIDGNAVKFMDKETLSFIQNRIINWFGVSLPILMGDYTDEQYQAFYEKTLEKFVIRFGQSFSRGLFSSRELDVGNQMVFYQKDMNYLSTKAKLNLIKTAGEQGLLTDDQKLALLGYPPVENGARRTQSLNYIDVNLINQYQLQVKSKEAVKEDGK